MMDLCEKWVNVVDGAVYGNSGAELANFVARIIFSEQTSLKDGAMEAVVWTMINRLLSKTPEIFLMVKI